ncbi:MAG: hypothetical protein PHG99_04335 [Erysipelotrichaceae bacterium]|nr:hypothetical protein [Erysipelotrichaceae bacterium]
MTSLKSRIKSTEEKNNIDVYCDNVKLREYILDQKPSMNGLYPHEIRMIHRAKIGHLKTENTVFPLGHFGVLYPALLLKSLVKRGFIIEATPAKLLEYSSASVLQSLMHNRNLKCNGPSSKKKMKEVIIENYSFHEIKEFLKFNLYVPTEMGEQELEQNKYISENVWGSSENSGYRLCNYILKEEITMTCLPFQELHISKDDFICSLNGEVIDKNHYYRYIKTKPKLNILIDGRKIWSNITADLIYFLSNTKKIIVSKYNYDKSEPFIISSNPYESTNLDLRTMNCTCYDIISKKILFTETIEAPRLYTWTTEDYREHKESISYEGIVVNDRLNYYVSVNNMLAFHIISELFNETINIEKLQNYLEKDDSLNFLISVNVCNMYERNIIMYMIAENYLQAPVIKGLTLAKILRLLRLSNKSKTDIAINEDSNNLQEYEREIVDEVKIKCNQDWNVFLRDITNTYPKRIVFNDTFRSYSSKDGYKYDVNLSEVKMNKTKWDNEFKILKEKLMLDGKLTPRWINEFSLYSISVYFFPDSIYQYRSSWLERQSIDIFIPSFKIGIEYQGEQHYSAVDYFGGENAYEYTKDRDERKKLLCELNGVKLIEWSYTLKVTTNNFIDIFKSLGINLSSKE